MSTSSAVTVSGNGSYGTPNPQVVPTAIGNYHWVAVYSGSSPNTSALTHNAACDDTNEDVTVRDVPSSLFTGQSWVPSDSMTVSAPVGGSLARIAHFAFYTNATCTGTAVYTDAETVSGTSPQTVTSGNAPAQSASGSYSWSVSYDSTNPAQRDIPATCQETSGLTVTNGGTVSSP
ncbi:hypothetical protein GCM10022237_02730 [Nocardioides ginsengisoli]|uniref:Uncharacterized protein n=1 Tax=Nocardioides ginsengisoli TaxID=363868 RepID=A0ABW3W3D1_9ACTN